MFVVRRLVGDLGGTGLVFQCEELESLDSSSFQDLEILLVESESPKNAGA